MDDGYSPEQLDALFGPLVAWSGTPAPWRQGYRCFSINGSFYERRELPSGEATYHLNRELLQRDLAEEKKRKDLYWALRTRVLTDDEMALAEQYGETLNIERGLSYNAAEKRKELGESYYLQARFRALAAGLIA